MAARLLALFCACAVLLFADRGVISCNSVNGKPAMDGEPGYGIQASGAVLGRFAAARVPPAPPGRGCPGPASLALHQLCSHLTTHIAGRIQPDTGGRRDPAGLDGVWPDAGSAGGRAAAPRRASAAPHGLRLPAVGRRRRHLRRRAQLRRAAGGAAGHRRGGGALHRAGVASRGRRCATGQEVPVAVAAVPVHPSGIRPRLHVRRPGEQPRVGGEAWGTGRGVQGGRRRQALVLPPYPSSLP